MSLVQKECTPCHKGAPKLSNAQITLYLEDVASWKVVSEDEELKLFKKFELNNFEETMTFVNRVAAISQQNGHHPVMLVEFRMVSIWWWTHKIEGLHQNDFIMAAKTDDLF